MTRLRLLAVVVVLAILTISTGVVMAAPPQQAPDVTFSPTSVTVMEPGGTATYTVVYDTAPADDVTITVTSTHMQNATVFPTSLTFNANRREHALEHAADSDRDCRRRRHRPRS